MVYWNRANLISETKFSLTLSHITSTSKKPRGHVKPAISPAMGCVKPCVAGEPLRSEISQHAELVIKGDWKKRQDPWICSSLPRSNECLRLPLPSSLLVFFFLLFLFLFYLGFVFFLPFFLSMMSTMVCVLQLSACMDELVMSEFSFWIFFVMSDQSQALTARSPDDDFVLSSPISNDVRVFVLRLFLSYISFSFCICWILCLWYVVV